MDEARYRAAERKLWDSVGVTPTERRVSLPHLGGTVRVLEAGEGPTVLFVHGANNSATSWASLVARLDGFHCVALDRPGCGLSDPRVERLADIDALGAFADALIVDVLDAIGTARAHIVATSFGGYFALRAAAAHPERIRSIMEFSYPLGAGSPPLPLRLATVPWFGRLVTAMPQTDYSVRALLRRIGLREALDAGRFTPVMLDWYVSLLRDTDTLRNELRAGPTFPVLRMDDRVLLPARVLAKIDAPIHLYWGEGDPFGGADVARRFVPLLTDAELELVSGAGHAPWIDDPGRAASATRMFLDAQV